MECKKARIRIGSNNAQTVFEITQFLDRISKEERECPECGEPVCIQQSLAGDSPFPSEADFSPPIVRAEIIGCDPVLGQVMEEITLYAPDISFG